LTTALHADVPVEVEIGAGQEVKAGAVQGAVQGFSGDDVFRGLGSPAEKSDELLLLSVHPALALITALVFDGAGVGPEPSKQFAVVPKPTISTTPIVGHDPDNAVTEFTNATLPAVADMAIVPIASGVGSAVVPPLPTACLIRKYCPGLSVMLGKVVTVQDVPVAEAYCTDQPLRPTGELVPLNNSIKS
jgi:hypothetical protein